MPEVDGGELARRLESALTGDAGRLHSLLRRHSHLPGPRGNLELAAQFADLVARQAGGPHRAALWEVVLGLAALGPETAPGGDPGEFLAFCGTLGAGVFTRDGKRRSEAWRVVRRAAEDPRWRLREAAAQSIQRALAVDRSGALGVLEGWAITGGWLLLRAVVAGLADPPLLADPALAATALQLHGVVLQRFGGATDRRDPDWRVLRQGLGFTLSVVVAALPQEGFSLLRSLAVRPDADLAWVLRSNLTKARLTRAHPADVERVSRLLPG